MAAQKQDDQLERTFSSYVRIQVVVLKTYLGRWTIGRSGERGSGISVLPARYDADDDYKVSRVKWSNQGKGVAPSPTPQCSSYWKGSLRVTLDYGSQLFYNLYVETQICTFSFIQVWIKQCMKRNLSILILKLNQNEICHCHINPFNLPPAMSK